MLSLAKWIQKVERLVSTYDVPIAYIAAGLRYQRHNTGIIKHRYTIYISDLTGPTIYGSDWKIVLKETEVIIRKKGFKKSIAEPTNTHKQ